MEYWDIYDAQGRSTGRVHRKGEPLKPGDYHLAGEIWVCNAKQEFLLQQRSLACEQLPGVWSHTTGRIRAGEDSRSGCVRELAEELGLMVQPSELQLLRRIIREDGLGLIWDVYLLHCEVDLSQLVLQTEEVAQARWVDAAEFKRMLARGDIFHYPEIEQILQQVLTRLAQG